MWTVAFTWLNTVALLIVVASSSIANGAEVALSGTCDYVTRPENELPLYSARYNFEVSVSGCSWMISYKDTAAATNADLLIARSVASCDGTNIYFVEFHGEAAVKKAWGDRYNSVSNELPRAMAKIYPGDYPPPQEAVLQKLWFAFASSCVLDGSNGRKKPPFLLDPAIFYDDPEFRCAYYWTTNESQPLQRQVTL